MRIAKAAGAFALVRDSAWRHRRLLILCYHGVSMDDEHEWSPTLYITQERFRARLRVLRDGGYTILPLTEAMRRLYDGTLPPRSVALTFDDGAVDFERRALPVLREFNAPATVYLTTFYCTARFPVFDTVVSYVLWRGRHSGGNVASHCESLEPLPVATDEDRKRAHSALRQFATVRHLSAQDKDALVARIAATLRVNYDEIVARGTLQIMPPDTVRHLPEDLVDVQLHTHRHRTPRNRALFLREITDNAAMIRELRGAVTPLENFCYPSGDYAGEFLGWLAERDVRYATTCVPDIASIQTNPLLTPRFVDTMDQSETVFEAWVSGFAALLPTRREHQLDVTRLTVEATGSPLPSGLST